MIFVVIVNLEMLVKIDEMNFRFLHPITYGDYPKTMHEYVGYRLPKFSVAESRDIKGSYDFLGMNYYTGNFADDVPVSNSPNKSYSADMRVALTSMSSFFLI